MNESQKQQLQNAIVTGSRVVAVRGSTGTGKSFEIDTAVARANAASKTVDYMLVTLTADMLTTDVMQTSLLSALTSTPLMQQTKKKKNDQKKKKTKLVLVVDGFDNLCFPNLVSAWLRQRGTTTPHHCLFLVMSSLYNPVVHRMSFDVKINVGSPVSFGNKFAIVAKALPSESPVIQRSIAASACDLHVLNGLVSNYSETLQKNKKKKRKCDVDYTKESQRRDVFTTVRNILVPGNMSRIYHSESYLEAQFDNFGQSHLLGMLHASMFDKRIVGKTLIYSKHYTEFFSSVDAVAFSKPNYVVALELSLLLSTKRKPCKPNMHLEIKMPPKLNKARSHAFNDASLQRICDTGTMVSSRRGMIDELAGIRMMNSKKIWSPLTHDAFPNLNESKLRQRNQNVHHELLTFSIAKSKKCKRRKKVSTSEHTQ
jgi:hypothetical protein